MKKKKFFLVFLNLALFFIVSCTTDKTQEQRELELGADKIAFKQGGSWGIKNGAGDVLIEPQFKTLHLDNEQRIVGIRQQIKWFVNVENTKLELAPQFSELISINDNILFGKLVSGWIRFTRDGRLLNKLDSRISSLNYSTTHNLFQATLRLDTPKTIQYTPQTGETIQSIISHENAILNYAGEVIIGPVLEELRPYAHGITGRSSNYSNEKGFYDKDGNYIKLENSKLEKVLTPNLVAIFDDNTYQIADTKGKIVSELEFVEMPKVCGDSVTGYTGKEFILFDIKTYDKKTLTQLDRVRECSSGIWVVKKESNYGMMSEDGELILPMEYAGIGKFKKIMHNDLEINVALAVKGKQNWLVDQKGEIVSGPYYRTISAESANMLGSLSSSGYSSDEHFMHGNTGIVISVYDSSGKKELLNSEELDGKTPHRIVAENLLAFTQNHLIGIMNINTKVVLIQPQFSEICSEFVDGLCQVKKGNLWGVIDEQGEIVLPITYEGLGIPSNGFIPFKENNLWGLLSLNGDVVVDTYFDLVLKPFIGVALVKKDGLWGVIDTNFKVADQNYLLVPKYEIMYRSSAAPEFLRVRENGKYGIFRIVVDNNVTIERVYSTIYNNIRYKGEGVFSIRETDEFVYEKNGQLLESTHIASSEFLSSLGSFFEGVATFELNDETSEFHGKKGFVNSNLEVVIEPIYDDVRSISQNRSAVSQNEQWGFIDGTGTIIVPLQYFEVKSFQSGLAKVRDHEDSDHYFIDLNGDPVSEMNFFHTSIYNSGIIGAHCNLYIYKHTGEKLLDHNFCSIKRLPSNNNFIASRTLGNSNKFSVINEFGETKLVDYNNSTKPIYNTRIPGEISSGTLRFYQKENFDSNVETIGLIGVAGKVLIPAEYRSLHAFDNYQVARVRHHSFADILLVNYQNEQIIPPASHFGIIFNGEYFFVKPSNCPNSECEGQLLSYQGRVFETAPF